MSSAVPSAPKPGLFQLIEWRLVAAIGLPVWAFVLGAVVMHKPAPAASPPTPTETAKVPPASPLPPGSQPGPVGAPVPTAVVHPEVQPVTVVVPIPVPAAPVESISTVPAEFKLPASEVMPGGLCQTYGTRINFHPDMNTAMEEAKQAKKMLLVLHISGNFDDPGFT
jgi:hypothetical protein